MNHPQHFLHFAFKALFLILFFWKKNMASDVTFSDQGSKIVLDNGTIQIIISKPGGLLTHIKYAGMDNLLESSYDQTRRGYWDLNWNEVNGSGTYYRISGTQFKLVNSDGDKVEVSFTRPYKQTNDPAMVPLTVDIRFVLLRGHSGFYTYGIYQRSSGWDDFDLEQTRIVFRLRKDRFANLQGGLGNQMTRQVNKIGACSFHYMALGDNKIRRMPTPDDLSNDRSQGLDYQEARLLTNPIEASLKGQVDDKYQDSLDNKDNKVHGWVSKQSDPAVGFWIITPSNEFRNGGPTRQDLTSHVGPTCLAMFHSLHYAGIELCSRFRNGEAWKKVFGPVYVYLNRKPVGDGVRALWDDAKLQMKAEVEAWPYDWPSSSDYPQARDRGQVTGRLLVHDEYSESQMISATGAYVGLAFPGPAGSWQKESKGYQFWVQADYDGLFTIKHVLAGTYSLYAYVPSVIGDYTMPGNITISAGDKVSIGNLSYQPPRHGPTVWNIGTPSRTAAEFYIPDPNPKYNNSIYVDIEKWRNYGLWERYSELYPSEDLVYTVGVSDWKRDWYFAQSTRRQSNGTYKETTWQIKFNLSSFDENFGAYKFQMAIAQAERAAVQVRVNDASALPLYETPAFGRDNAIARHGIHGLYELFSIDIPASFLKKGDNSIYLTQRKASLNSYNGVMYDYLRLEAPPSLILKDHRGSP